MYLINMIASVGMFVNIKTQENVKGVSPFLDSGETLFLGISVLTVNL